MSTFIRVDCEAGVDLILNTDHIVSVHRENAKVTVRTSDGYVYAMDFGDNGEAQSVVAQVTRELKVGK